MGSQTERLPTVSVGAVEASRSDSNTAPSSVISDTPSSNPFPPAHRKALRRRPFPSRSLSQLFLRLSALSRLSLFLPMRSLRPVPHTKALLRLRHSLLFNAILGIIVSLLFTLAACLFVVYSTPSLTLPISARAGEPSPFTQLYASNSSLQSTLYNSDFKKYVNAELEASFSLPTSLSTRIPIPQRYALLTKLQSTRVHRTTRPPLVFILHVVGAKPDDRIRAIAAAITYARNTDRFLLILWDTAYGGEAFGKDALRDIQPPGTRDFLVSHVSGLRLAPNVAHWSDFDMLYFTSPTNDTNPLDRVADIATRHIFFRSDNPVEGKYAAQLPGIFIVDKTMQPGPLFKRDWDNFVRHWTFPHLTLSAVSGLLNRVYGVPRIFINGMAEDQQRLMLRLLDKSRSKRALFVHTQYGLGNRLRALGSAMAIARVTGRVLVLIWEPDVHLDCRFTDLFVNEYVQMEKLVLTWPPSRTAYKDQALQTVDFFNFMRNEGEGRHNPMRDLVNPRNGRHVYVKTAYVIRSSFTPRIISTQSQYWKIMRDELVPLVEIMQLVLDPRFANIRDMIGVHIRARTIQNDIKGVGHKFYGKASRTTDHWRRRTGLKTFEDKIMQLSLKYKYFVAADMKETIYELERKFGAHRILSLPRDGDCVTRDVECVKLAMADILLLSRVSTLLGSHWSSFSEGAVRLSGKVRVLFAGLHFG